MPCRDVGIVLDISRRHHFIRQFQMPVLQNVFHLDNRDVLILLLLRCQRSCALRRQRQAAQGR